MASSTSNTSRNGRVSFSGGTASLLLERSRISSANRRPTPDSEALVSSDEEHSQPQQSQSQSLAYRRASTSRPQTSWLSDIGHPQPARKFSIGGLSLGSSGSQPPTPSSETTPRLQTSLQSSGGGPASFQASIWSSERKQPPSRLAEVSQSPTSVNPPGIEQSLQSPGERSSHGIGVEIPLDPVFKSGQRAMSFSVGQADQLNRLRSNITRKNSAGGLSLGHGLAQLREDDDDLNSVDTDSDAGVKLPPEMAADPHGLLKQAIRQRTTPISAGLAGARNNVPTRSMSFRTPDYALDEEEPTLSKAKTTWTTALGFDLGPSGLESRRHSLAGVPLRARAVSFAPTRLREEPPSLLHTSNHAVPPPAVQSPTADLTLSQHGEAEYNYFGTQATGLRNADYHRQAGFTAPGRHILYWIQFKCERGGVYYVVDGSGLSPKKGEMVLVEGDRGSDLGTVHAVDITPTQVKELRQEFQYRHFRWLIDFSRTAQTNPQVRWALSESVDARTAAARHPSNFHHGEDAKPKLIKRMAHMHEIQGLVHKEGAEAKAKRVCQQKVVEHGLQMEILDAEYQWDQRKLTFYYFAETYVNFNELVTDLFKIFKTRIWMSAVNPASFASAAPPGALGLAAPQPQGSFGPGPMGTLPMMQAPSAAAPLTQAPGMSGAGFPRDAYAGFESVGGWGGFSSVGGYNQPSQPTFGYDASTGPALGSYNPPTTSSSPLGNAFASQWPVPPANTAPAGQESSSPVPWVRQKPNAPQYNQYTGAPIRNTPNAWTTLSHPTTTFSGSPTATPSTAGPPSTSTFVPPRNGHRTPQNETQAAWYAAFANMNLGQDGQAGANTNFPA